MATTSLVGESESENGFDGREIVDTECARLVG